VDLRQSFVVLVRAAIRGGRVATFTFHPAAVCGRILQLSSDAVPVIQLSSYRFPDAAGQLLKAAATKKKKKYFGANPKSQSSLIISGMCREHMWPK